DVRRTVADVVDRHGGALSPESGVELVAAFGADGAHEDDVVRAARAAAEIREVLRGRAVTARLAVGTGRLLVKGSVPVLAGAVVGRTRRALHDAAADEIQLTAVAARLGGDAFELDAGGRLLGVSPVRPRPSGDLGPLVGRDAELARLRAAFEGVVEAGKPGHVVVVGEAGIGKSRLVATFADDVDAVVLHAACTPYGQGITFLPLRELADHAAALDENAPALGELDSADAALAAARRLLEHVAARGPVVVVLDDLHWAVPTFLDLVEYVVRAVDVPMLVVSVTRPELLERRPAWGEGATMLEPLGGDDARMLVDALPERDLLDDALVAAILETAVGVPLFVEQLAAHAAETDVADEGIPTSLDALLASRIDVLEPGERAVLSRAAVVGRAFSPEALGALTPAMETRELGGRLASLERRRLVRTRGDEHEFVHPLVRGAAYDAIGRPERAAMHETFARWLDDRGEGDELVGTHLERAVVDMRGLNREPGELAGDAVVRLGRAGERAVWRRDNHGAVSLLLRAAALLPELDPRRLELECLASVPLKNLWESRRAVELLDDVAYRSARLGSRRLELRARVEQLWPSIIAGEIDVETPVATLNEAVEVCDAEGDLLGVARAWHMLVVVESRLRHEFDAAVRAGMRAEEHYERYGTPGVADSLTVGLLLESTMNVADAVAFCESRLRRERPASRAGAIALGLGALKALTGDFDRARDLVQQARSWFLDIADDVAVVTDVSHTWASVEILALDAGSARIVAGRGLDAARTIDDRVWQNQFLSLLAEIELLDGQPRAALDLSDDARKTANDSDLHQALGWRLPRACALAALGRPDEAEDLAREGFGLVESTDYLVGRGLSRAALARVLGEAGRHDEAASVADDAAGLFDKKGATVLAERARAQAAALRRGEPALRAPLERA
ncbi:MAG TPA: AAA family ATPase, partial [Gaiella sp.]|nr:AAA family ATPase [Gaiella sp.]